MTSSELIIEDLLSKKVRIVHVEKVWSHTNDGTLTVESALRSFGSRHWSINITISLVQRRKTFDTNTSFYHVKVEPIPCCERCGTRSWELGQRMEVNPSNTSNDDEKNTEKSCTDKCMRVRHAQALSVRFYY